MSDSGVEAQAYIWNALVALISVESSTKPEVLQRNGGHSHESCVLCVGQTRALTGMEHLPNPCHPPP